jgi:hypothetical protein
VYATECVTNFLQVGIDAGIHLTPLVLATIQLFVESADISPYCFPPSTGLLDGLPLTERL